jgi:hypothetical protein
MDRDSLANLMTHAREIRAGPGEALLPREQGPGSDNGDETVFPFYQGPVCPAAFSRGCLAWAK